MSRPSLPHRLLTLGAVAGASFALAAGAAAAIDGGFPGATRDAPAASAAATKKQTAARKKAAARRGPRGPRGLRGLTGRRGPQGDRGATGATGVPGAQGSAGREAVVHQPFSVNWQNGQFTGRDRATFTAPGIGQGQVICSRDAQMITFRRYDARDDVALWTAKVFDRQDGLSAFDVKEGLLTQFTGEEVNEGFNLGDGALSGDGSYRGIIASYGDRTTPGGAGPAPTAFHLTFHWRFGDQFGDRCYVAGSFTTER